MPAEFEFPSALAGCINATTKVVVLTGAGISADSGIPTFRDSQIGLWKNYKPQELASIRAFEKDPKLVWDWYRWRRGLIDRAEPNPAHYALKQLEECAPETTIITQNIDGLHRKAGTTHLIELHGNIHRARCLPEDKSLLTWDYKADIPLCPDCGGRLRPDVVWFGEPLPNEELAYAVRCSRECDLFLSIGTSGLIEPAASLAYEALRCGAKVIEINLEATPLTVYATHVFTGQAKSILPPLIEWMITSR